MQFYYRIGFKLNFEIIALKSLIKRSFRIYSYILMSATDKSKLDCPIGYVICENDQSDLQLSNLKMTFKEAEIYCGHFNSTICK